MRAESQSRTLASAYVLNLLSKLADIAYFLILVRIIGKSEVGAYNALMSYSAFLYLVLDAGLVEASLREYAQRKATLGHVLRRCLLPRVGILAALAAALLLFPQTARLVGGLEFACYAILYQAAFLACSLGIAYLRAHGLQERANVALAGESLARFAVVIGLLSMGQSDLRTIWWLTVAAKLLGLLLVIWPILQSRGQQSTAPAPLASAGWMLFGSQKYFMAIALLTLMQTRLDWLMVSLFFDETTLASYSVANRFYEMIIFVVGIGITTMYPWLCRNNAEGNADHRLEAMTRLQLYAGPALIVGAYIGFPFVNQYLWGGRYSEVTGYLVWLLPCVMLAIGNMKLYYDLLAARQERYILPISAISTSLQLAFNGYAIPRYGVAGAIAGMWVLNATNLLLFGLAKRLAAQQRSIRQELPIETWLGFILAAGLLAGSILLNALLLLPLAVLLFCTGAYLERNKLLLGRYNA